MICNSPLYDNVSLSLSLYFSCSLNPSSTFLLFQRLVSDYMHSVQYRSYSSDAGAVSERKMLSSVSFLSLTPRLLRQMATIAAVHLKQRTHWWLPACLSWHLIPSPSLFFSTRILSRHIAVLGIKVCFHTHTSHTVRVSAQHISVRLQALWTTRKQNPPTPTSHPHTKSYASLEDSICLLNLAQVINNWLALKMAQIRY